MKIAMLARNANLYSHQRLVEAALARGHEIDILNTLRVTMNITSHRPEAYYQGAKLGKYDAVIPRIGASITFYGLAVLRQFEMMNVWSLNESVAIGRSRDKLRSLQILARKGLGLPVTAFAHDPKQTDEVIKMVGLDYARVGRPEQNRLTACLKALGYEGNGKFTSGEYRHSARYTRVQVPSK